MIDLRSDTVTKPTAAMRAAMAAAEVGDDVFGDDPTVNALQDRIAAQLGKEAALFMPSGTQSNLTAVLCHCERGDEFIVGQHAHAYKYEAGGAAVLGSVQPQPLEQGADGTLALDAIAAAIKPDDLHFARTRLLALENTFGGQCAAVRPTRSMPPRWPGGMGWPRTWTARGCSTPRWRWLARVATPGPRRGAWLGCTTPCRCASARGWGRPWARPWSGQRELMDTCAPLAQAVGWRPAPVRPAWPRRRCMRWTTMSIRLADDHALATAPGRRPGPACPG